MELVGGGLVRDTATRVISRTWSPAKAAVLERIASRPVILEDGWSAVSITFDDVPRNVLENAVPLLEEHGVRGTFYVAPGMPGAGTIVLGEQDVRSLVAAGHHVGCHSMTHYSLREGTAAGLHRDAIEGKRALARVTGQAGTDHFAFPYGAVSPRAKELLSRTFATMRTSTRGINTGRVDLTYLRAENLYSGASGLDLQGAERLVNSTATNGGWLIFYTHGVGDRPGPYDTSTDDFRRVLEVVVRSTLPVLSVAEAYESLQEEKEPA